MTRSAPCCPAPTAAARRPSCHGVQHGAGDLDIYDRLHSHDEIVYCPNCRRILYIPEELTPEGAVGASGRPAPAPARRDQDQGEEDQGVQPRVRGPRLGAVPTTATTRPPSRSRSAPRASSASCSPAPGRIGPGRGRVRQQPGGVRGLPRQRTGRLLQGPRPRPPRAQREIPARAGRSQGGGAGRAGSQAARATGARPEGGDLSAAATDAQSRRRRWGANRARGRPGPVTSEKHPPTRPPTPPRRPPRIPDSTHTPPFKCRVRFSASRAILHRRNK